MKKLFALLMSLTLLLALAGCGSDNSANNNQSGSSGLTPEAITERGVLRVGVKTDVPGFGLQNIADNTYSGLEIDLAYKIAEELGVENVEFTPVTAATRGQLLDSGDIDMVAATFTINEERKVSWNFTTPYYTDAVSLLVKNDSGIETFEDLQDIIVGVATGSTSKAALIAAAADAGVTLDEDKNFAEFASYPEIKSALDSGRVQAFSVDGSILAGYLDNTNHIVETIRFSPQDYGLATKKDATAWANYLEDLITGWLADGTMAQIIADNGVVASYTE